MALSDYIPFVCLIACIHIGGKGEWEALLTKFLRPPNNDVSTDAGSHMLSNLKEELYLESILGTHAFGEDMHATLNVREFDEEVDPLDTFSEEERIRSHSLPNCLNLTSSQTRLDDVSSTIPPPPIC